MTTNIYISMLRGINVSGKNIIKMETLKKVFEQLGFKNINTYLQSGNVIFSNSKSSSPANLQSLITSEIKKNLGINPSVIVLTKDELKKIIEQCPFTEDKEKKFIHYTFLSEPPRRYNLESINKKKAPNEEVFISERAVYLYCPNGYGKTKLNNSFFEKILQTNATTRNFRSTNNILKIMEGEE